MDFQSAIAWFATPENWLQFAQLLAAGVTACATFALWQVTKVLAKETKTLARMTSRPFVVCSLVSSGADPQAMNLTLENAGNATAFDVQLELFPALNPFGDQPAQTRWDVSLLPPGQRLALSGINGFDVHDTVYTAHVSWAALPGGKVREVLSHRFAAKDGYHNGYITQGPHQIAEELKKIRAALNK